MSTERITSRQNPLLQRLVRLQGSAAERRRCGELVGDGWKLLDEALRFAKVKAVIAAEGQTLPPLPEGVRTALVPPQLLAAVSRMDTPQGVLFLAARPEEARGPLPAGSLVLDGVQDPGNVGTVLRAGEAFGARAIVLTEDCADPFGPKALRASMGSAFRQPVMEIPRAVLPGRCREAGLRLVVTALSDSSQPLEQVPLKQAVVVIGSEGRGASQQLLAAAQAHVIIPMEGQVESLNAAAAATVLLWELRRARQA